MKECQNYVVLNWLLSLGDLNQSVLISYPATPIDFAYFDPFSHCWSGFKATGWGMMVHGPDAIIPQVQQSE